MPDRLLADHLLSDLYTYASDGLGFDLHEQPHRKMAAFFESALPDPPHVKKRQKQYSYAAPRETLKTSIGVQSLAEYYLFKWKRLYNYDGRVLIVRATDQAAETVTLAISQDLTGNPVITQAFGNVSINSKTWKTGALTFNNREIIYREPSIDSTGTGGSRTGFHYDLILIDDLCNETNYKSEAAMHAARLMIQACFPILNSNGSIIHIGTRWGNLDTTGWILEVNERARKEGKPEPWVVEIHGAWDENGNLFYPGWLDEETLADRQSKMDAKLFASQYLNKVIPDEAVVFRSEWLAEFEGEYTPKGYQPALLYADDTLMFVTSAIICDPAATAASTSNQTAMHFVLMTANNIFWVYDSWKGREVPDKIIGRLVDWVEEYAPDVLSIDTLGQQVLWIPLLEPELRARKLHVRIVMHKGEMVQFRGQEMRASRSLQAKAARIESMQPLFRQHKIRLRKHKCGPIRQEALTYTGPTRNEHYDALDALAQAPTVLKPPRSLNVDEDDLNVAYAETLERMEAQNEAWAYEDEPGPRRKVPGTNVGRTFVR